MLGRFDGTFRAAGDRAGGGGGAGGGFHGAAGDARGLWRGGSAGGGFESAGVWPDGKVKAVRYTATKSAELRAEPIGTIDPAVSLVSFWNGDKPIAVLSYYACHPQSYYRTGIPNPDFPGIARFVRGQAVPDALHVHFNGAGGNIGAGKFNDGSKDNRVVLAMRLADGMTRAWQATTKTPITPQQVRLANDAGFAAAGDVSGRGEAAGRSEAGHGGFDHRRRQAGVGRALARAGTRSTWAC